MQIEMANTIFYCRNWSASVAFYRDELKLEVAFSNDWFVEFRINSTASLSIADEKRTRAATSHGEGAMLSLKVDDLDALHLEMESSQLNPTRIESVWNSRVFSLFDPEGIRVEFWSED